MFNRCFARFAVVFLCLMTIFPLHAWANPVDEWTLATVPSLEYVSANESTHTVRIVSSNAANTEMYVENSSTGTSYSMYRDWQPNSNGDTFTVSLNEGDTIFLRIKARNVKGIETDFSQPLKIESGFVKPPKPVTRGQESGHDYVSIDFEHPTGNSVYWVQRLDKPSPERITSLPFRDSTVLPAREYTYEFWLDNNGVISDKNRITLWTKPQTPVVKVKETSSSQIVLEVDTLRNPDNIVIEAQVEGKPLPLLIEGKNVRATGLESGVDYQFRVRLKSANGEYTSWVDVNASTSNAPSRGSGGGSPSESEQEERFREDAKRIISELIYTTDGEINSESTWIELQLKNPTHYRVEATIEGKTQTLSTQSVKFDGLKDYQEYTVEIRISDGVFSHTDSIIILTPNRTSPIIQRAFYNEEGNLVKVEVRSVRGIRK